MKKVLFVVAAAMAIAACAKEETPEQKANKGALSFSATMEQQQDAVKSSLIDETKVSWTEGDLVYIKQVAGVGSAKYEATGSGLSTNFTKVDGTYDELNVGDIAVYPYDAVTGFAEGKVNFSIAAEQDYIENSFAQNANIAVGTITMINDKPYVSFHNVCGILKLSFMGDAKVARIEITGNANEKLCGNFTTTIGEGPEITEDGAPTADEKKITLNCGVNGVQLKLDEATNFYIIVPAKAFASGFSLNIVPVEGNKYFNKTIDNTRSNIINRSHIRVMPVRQMIFPATNILTGIFTVSSTGKKVRFSRGLLQAKYSKTTSSYTFQFAPSQWEYIGYASGNIHLDEQIDGGIVDSFGLSTDNIATPWGISPSTDDEDYTGNFVDWATHESVASLPFVFRTPTGKEWTYLLEQRTTNFKIDDNLDVENHRYAMACIHGVCGMLVFPDDFVWKTSTMGPVPPRFDAIYTDINEWQSVTYSDNEFESMETDGVVFLLATGTRNGNVTYSFGESAIYWSSTTDNQYHPKQGYANKFNIYYIYTNNGYPRHNGGGVRLVSEVE